MTAKEEEATQPWSERQEKRLDTAIAARALEIELFWKRSGFFWAFIVTAFAGFLATHQRQPRLAAILSGFGSVCAFAWTLANRGSKYWQENWEAKVERAERRIIGEWFGIQEKPKGRRNWLDGRRYSVSRLTIALSDYACAIWIGLLVNELLRSWPGREIPIAAKVWLVPAFVLGTVSYMIWMTRATRTRPDDSSVE